MSFARDVKEEIVKKRYDDCCCKFILWGMLKSRGKVVLNENKKWMFILKTSHGAIARFAYTMLDRLGVSNNISQRQEQYFDKKRKYQIDITDIKKMMEVFDIPSPFIPNPVLEDMEECCKAAFLIGMFLHSGSINSPTSKNYHFEIASNKSSTVEISKDFLFKSFNIPSKIIQRGEDYILYIKKSGLISDVLKIMQAPNAMLYFENEKIKRDYSVSMLRLNNTDFANREKSRLAAEKQMVEIEDALLYKDISKFNDFEVKYIELRNDNPDYSLIELAEELSSFFNMDVTKSKINHTIMKFRKLATKKREENNKKTS